MRKSADILKEMDAIVASAENENRPMTAEEQAEFDTLQVEYDKAVEAETQSASRAEQETSQRRDQLAAAHAAAAARPAAPSATRRPISAPNTAKPSTRSMPIWPKLTG